MTERQNQDKFNFRQNLATCWQGVCRSISWIMIVAYILIGGLILFCALGDFPFCIQRGLLGGAPYISLVAIIALIISALISVSSSNSRTALIFSFLFGLPALILIVLSIIRYIGAIIVAIVLFYFFIQLTQSRR